MAVGHRCWVLKVYLLGIWVLHNSYSAAMMTGPTGLLLVVRITRIETLQALLGMPEEYGSFRWKPEHGTAIRVMALYGSGEVRSFKLPAMFNYHWANVFEAQHAELGACMCLDVFAADDARSLNMFDLDKCSDVNLDNFEMLLKYDPIFSLPLPAGLPSVASALKHMGVSGVLEYVLYSVSQDVLSYIDS